MTLSKRLFVYSSSNAPLNGDALISISYETSNGNRGGVAVCQSLRKSRFVLFLLRNLKSGILHKVKYLPNFRIDISNRLTGIPVWWGNWHKPSPLPPPFSCYWPSYVYILWKIASLWAGIKQDCDTPLCDCWTHYPLFCSAGWLLGYFQRWEISLEILM
jgi:hypothetical protein